MKLNWGHGVVIALGAFIAFILGMIFLFPNGQKNSELISDNYYEEELHYQQVIDAKKNADLLAEKPNAKLTNEGILVSFPKEFNNQNSKFHFYLYRTDDQNLDIKKDFSLEAENSHMIPKSILKAGSYTLKLSWNTNKIQYQRDFDIQWK